MTGMKDTIEAKLTENLTPDSVVVTDDSHLHAGHAGARLGGARSGRNSSVTSSGSAGLTPRASARYL